VFDGTLTDNFQLQIQFVDAENSIHRDQRQNQYSLIFLSPRSVSVIAIYVLFLSDKQGRSVHFTGWLMVFNDIFNNISFISWQLVLLVEETAVSRIQSFLRPRLIAEYELSPDI
jgi:hypothetical protein